MRGVHAMTDRPGPGAFSVDGAKYVLALEEEIVRLRGRCDEWKRSAQAEIADRKAAESELRLANDRRKRDLEMVRRMATYGPGEGTTPEQALETISTWAENKLGDR